MRRYGRRNALQVGSLFGVLSGLISCVAVLIGSFCAASARYVLRRALCRRASVLPLRRRGYGERGIPAESHFLGAGRRHLCRHYRAAARHLHQGFAVAASLCRDLSRPVIVRSAGRRRSPVRQDSARAATSCPTAPAVEGNRADAAFRRGGLLRHGQLRNDEHDHDLGAAGDGRLRSLGHRRRARDPMARAWDVRRRAFSPAR